jgi:hypothetical protein
MADRIRDWWDGMRVAWENRSGEGFGALFTDDAEYYWTPFDKPQVGAAEITARTTQAMTNQRDVKFRYDVMFEEADRSIVRWYTEFTRARTGAKIKIDGIGYMELAPSGKAILFREWWHGEETA